VIVDGIHGAPFDSTGLPSTFAGTDIRLDFFLFVNGTNQISGKEPVKRASAPRIE
jgi:hypothetical protein